MIHRREELEARLQRLMARVLAGDGASYQDLLTTVTSLLRGYLLNRGHGDADAEDLVQDVLISLHRKKHLYDPHRPFLPWLFAITRYRVIDVARAAARRPSTTALDDLFDPPSEEHLRLGGALAVEDALQALPERQRRIVVMAKLDGRPLAEVAERMRMSVTAVKVAVHRAVKKMREAFEP